jgi:hypothetical protein
MRLTVNDVLKDFLKKGDITNLLYILYLIQQSARVTINNYLLFCAAAPTRFCSYRPSSGTSFTKEYIYNEYSMVHYAINCSIQGLLAARWPHVALPRRPYWQTYMQTFLHICLVSSYYGKQRAFVTLVFFWCVGL